MLWISVINVKYQEWNLIKILEKNRMPWFTMTICNYIFLTFALKNKIASFTLLHVNLSNFGKKKCFSFYLLWFKFVKMPTFMKNRLILGISQRSFIRIASFVKPHRVFLHYKAHTGAIWRERIFARAKRRKERGSHHFTSSKHISNKYRYTKLLASYAAVHDCIGRSLRAASALNGIAYKMHNMRNYKF